MTDARLRSSRYVRPGVSTLVLALTPLLTLSSAPVFAQAPEIEAGEVTFAKDVAPILQQSCQVWHC